MNGDFNKHELLNEVFGEAASAEFRAELLGKTLREVHRRGRLRRQIQVFSTTVAAFAVIALGVRFWLGPKGPASSRPNLMVVHSELLDPRMLVVSDTATFGLVRSSDSTFTLLRTSDAERPFELINDNQLLALLGGRPAALVYRGPARAELVFLNPDDQNGFPAP